MSREIWLMEQLRFINQIPIGKRYYEWRSRMKEIHEKTCIQGTSICIPPIYQGSGWNETDQKVYMEVANSIIATPDEIKWAIWQAFDSIKLQKISTEERKQKFINWWQSFKEKFGRNITPALEAEFQRTLERLLVTEGTLMGMLATAQRNINWAQPRQNTLDTVFNKYLREWEILKDKFPELITPAVKERYTKLGLALVNDFGGRRLVVMRPITSADGIKRLEEKIEEWRNVFRTPEEKITIVKTATAKVEGEIVVLKKELVVVNEKIEGAEEELAEKGG